jgi:hypothetical protein
MIGGGALTISCGIDMFRGVEYTELIGGELNENNVD